MTAAVLQFPTPAAVIPFPSRARLSAGDVVTRRGHDEMGFGEVQRLTDIDGVTWAHVLFAAGVLAAPAIGFVVVIAGGGRPDAA